MQCRPFFNGRGQGARDEGQEPWGATAIAKAFGIGRASVYRVPEAVYVQVETRAGSAAWA